MRQFYDGEIVVSEYGLIDIRNKLEDIRDNLPELEKDRIELMNEIHKFLTLGRRLGAWTIGELIIIQEKQIEKNYESWKKIKGKSGDPPPATLREWWIRKYENEEVSFDYQMALRYKNARLETDPEIGDQLDVSKINVIKQAPQERKEELQRRAVEESWSVSKTKDEVQKAIQKEKFEAEIKPILPRIKKIELSGKNSLILTFTNEIERDAFNYVLNRRWPSISKEIWEITKP